MVAKFILCDVYLSLKGLSNNLFCQIECRFKIAEIMLTVISAKKDYLDLKVKLIHVSKLFGYTGFRWI
jgi:hypothetical protein